ncbi:MAG: hypothetical protein ABUT20_12085 [Bacteroidota bacterium]
MKKLILIMSMLVAFSGIWMTGCEPSKKGSGEPGSTDSLSIPNSGNTTDSSMHMDTSSHQKR